MEATPKKTRGEDHSQQGSLPKPAKSPEKARESQGPRRCMACGIVSRIFCRLDVQLEAVDVISQVVAETLPQPFRRLDADRLLISVPNET